MEYFSTLLPVPVVMWACVLLATLVASAAASLTPDEAAGLWYSFNYEVRVDEFRFLLDDTALNQNAEKAAQGCDIDNLGSGQWSAFMGTVSGDLPEYFESEIIPVWRAQQQSKSLADGTEVACSDTCGPLTNSDSITKIGCGKAECSGKALVVCQFE